MLLPLNILASDIANAKPRNELEHPACYAAVRYLSRDGYPLGEVRVQKHILVVDGLGKAALPAAIRDFTRAFDRGEPVQPINFSVELV